MINNKGFTLIELIMVTIILGILAAVAIPRYMTTVAKAEEAVEDEVISSITSGLEMYATEKLIDNGRRSWPTTPVDVLETKPAGYKLVNIIDCQLETLMPSFNDLKESVNHYKGETKKLGILLSDIGGIINPDIKKIAKFCKEKNIILIMEVADLLIYYTI